jgi:DNA-binding IclR family transcriptional regulator
MPAPQVHRYLQSLIAAGMAQQETSSGRYDLGPAALRLGLAALSRTDAFKAVDRLIGPFVERSGLTVQIAALGPSGPTIVRIYNGRPALLTTLHVGAVLPVTTSATGRVFLAYVPRSELDAIIIGEQRHDDKSVPNLDDVRDHVRAEGKAVETGTIIPGLHATAFPVFDLQGRAILAATSLVSEAAASKNSRTATAELGQICRQISLELGWQNGS